jgi:hypothetical protein
VRTVAAVLGTRAKAHDVQQRDSSINNIAIFIMRTVSSGGHHLDVLAGYHTLDVVCGGPPLRTFCTMCRVHRT